jgi:NitT/TauT family transport system substrate-binding protein
VGKPVKPGPEATRAAVVLIVGALALAGMGVGYFTHTMAAGPIAHDPIVLGTPRLLSFAPIWVGADRGFFERHGLNVTLLEYDTGLSAATGVQNGEAEFALVQKAFGNGSLLGIGSIARSELMYLVGRQDHGVANASDLGGKRVGVPRRTISEFYLSRFVTLHGQNLDGVALVDVSRSDGVEALCNGSVDAVVTAEPYLSAIRGRLGDGVSVMPVQSSQYTYAVLVGRDAWIAGHPTETVRFLQAVQEADDWIQGHPADAKLLLQDRLGMDGPELDEQWPRHQFSLSLDQSLILAMEDEGRWMIRNNLTDAETVPDYRRYLSTDGLERVSPGSVKIVG